MKSKFFATFFYTFLISLFCSNSYASSIKDYFANAKARKVSIENTSGSIYTILYAVGTAIAVCMLIYIAIKYIIANPAEKAQLKDRIWLYVGGAILLFIGVNILNVIANTASTITL